MSPRFSIRALMVAATFAAVGVFLWQTIPREGSPNLVGRITDQSGDPIANAEIILYSGFATRFPGQRSRTNENGEFRFVPLETGSYLSGQAGGFPTLFVGIRVACEGYEAADGAHWWNVEVPCILNRTKRLDLQMVRPQMDASDVSVQFATSDGS